MSQPKPRLKAEQPPDAQKGAAATRRIVVEEVSKMKTSIIEELHEMQNIITRDVIDVVQKYLDQELSRISRRTGTTNVQGLKEELKEELKDEMDKKIENMNNQIVLTNNRQLQVTKQLTKDMAGAITKAASQAAYQAVISEINTKIVPKVNDMVQYVNYQMQDTGELITDYRRAVEEQSRTTDLKMLTSGKGEDKKSWAGGSVRMIWDEDTVGI